MADIQVEDKLMDVIGSVFSAPSPGGLWNLQAALLERGVGVDDAIWTVLDPFSRFLIELEAKATARQYSHFASLLDIGAVGGVALQNILFGSGSDEPWRSMLFGGLSEGLMVLAARQYVKAWEGEMGSVYRRTAWNLYRILWTESANLNAELVAAARSRLIEGLLAPVHNPDLPGTAKAALIVRLYQYLLLIHLRRLLNGV